FLSVGDRSAALRTEVAFPPWPWPAQRLATLSGAESRDALHMPAFLSVGDRSAALRTEVAFPALRTTP
ncbi:hypothetical protein ACLM5J_17700, partial [Nocardioides sp. Bht2]|uniref:hypothetical protein n=1 Tax=Nocardioides sp. Bht2 TaxID=3392297 RepID=UPI0039B600F1